MVRRCGLRIMIVGVYRTCWVIGLGAGVGAGGAQQGLGALQSF